MLNPYLFVYGTLRSDYPPNPYQQQLLNSASRIDKAKFQGRLFLVKHYPGAIDSDDSSDQVFGELYLLHQPEQVLALLDDYEECSPHYPQPAEYVRCQRRVQTERGLHCDAWLYLYNWPTAQLRRIDSGDFVSLLHR